MYIYNYIYILWYTFILYYCLYVSDPQLLRTCYRYIPLLGGSSLIFVRLVIILRISWGDVPSGWEPIPGCGDHSDSIAPHDLVTPQ